MNEPKKELTFADTVQPLSELPKQPIRLGIQGAAGEGKTWAALTFPNVTVLNLDNKLGGYQAAYPDAKINVVTFDQDLVLNKLRISNAGFGKPNNPAWPLNIRDAVETWLTKFGIQIPAGHTLFLDSWTTLQNFFDIQSKLPHELFMTKSGEEDGFKFWGFKQKYSGGIMQLLKPLKCNVVVTFHETSDYDDDGRPTGKLKPLMQGGYAAQIPTQMTDFYRQICVSRDMKNYEVIKKTLGRDINGEREWLWQTRSTALFTGCCSIHNMPTLVPATYESLVKKY